MPRLLSILIILLFLTVTVRLGDALIQVMHGMQPELKSSVAMAEDAAPAKDAKDTAKTEAPKADAAKTDDKAVAGKDAPKTDDAAKTVIKDTTGDKVLPAAADNADPFAPQFSDEELGVLQSLSKRREQLNTRERDLDQREKLLQVAEKKVEQKVSELTVLKKQLEDLLGKQQQAEGDNIKQLVKIYENMKPSDAATIFNDLQGDVLLKIISAMSERKSALVLAAMDPTRARDISSRIAAMKALPSAVSASPPTTP